MPDLIGSSAELKHVSGYDGLAKLYEKALTEISTDLSFYFALIFTIQLLIVVLGATSAAIVAIQNEDNKKWSKPVAIILTLLLTVSASIQSSFRLKENADSLLRLNTQMSEEAIEIGLEMRAVQDPAKIHTSVSNRLRKYNTFRDQRLKIRWNVGSDSVRTEPINERPSAAP